MRFYFGLFLLVVLTACGSPANDAGGGDADADSATIDAVLDSGPEIQAAFEAAFGASAPVAMETDEFGELSFSPSQLIQIGSTYYLLSGGTGMDCHSCSGGLAVDRLEYTGGVFESVGERQVLVGTSWGLPPEVQTRTDLFTYPALVTTGGWSGQGCGVTSLSLAEMTPDGLVERVERINVYHSFEDMGVGPTEGEIVPRDPGSSFDVRYTGEQSMTITYELSGQVYVPSRDVGEQLMC